MIIYEENITPYVEKHILDETIIPFTIPPLESEWYPIQKWGYTAAEICPRLFLPYVDREYDEGCVLRLSDANDITSKTYASHAPINAPHKDTLFDSSVGTGYQNPDIKWGNFRGGKQVPYKGIVMQNTYHAHAYVKSISDLHEGWLGLGMFYISTNQFKNLREYKTTEIRHCDIHYQYACHHLVFIHTGWESFYVEREVLDLVLASFP